MAKTAWSKRERTRWQALVEWLEDEFPGPTPCKASRKRLGGDGLTFWSECGSVIWVSTRLPYGNAVETLLHEWAHHLSGVVGHELRDHSNDWGEAYATLYRSYQQWSEED